jgi:hypothetical protein
MLTDKDRKFLLKLADLCEQHKAEFLYTTDDNGIHITLDRRKVYVGFIFSGSGPRDLRAAAKA